MRICAKAILSLLQPTSNNFDQADGHFMDQVMKKNGLGAFRANHKGNGTDQQRK